MSVLQVGQNPFIFAGDAQGWITIVTNGLSGGAQSQTATFSAHTQEKDKNKNVIQASPIRLIFISAGGAVVSLDSAGRARFWT
jgi:hypothetical protein